MKITQIIELEIDFKLKNKKVVFKRMILLSFIFFLI